MPFYGGGGGIAHRLGMKPNWVLDLHNGGCAAFVLGFKLARTAAGVRRRAHRADRGRAERGRTDFRSGRRCDEGAGRGTRRRCGGRTGHVVGRVTDPRRRMPHLRRVRRRHDHRRRPAPQVVAARTGRGLHRLHRIQDHQGAGARQPAGARGGASGVRSNRREAQGHRLARDQPAEPGLPAQLAGRAGVAQANDTATPSTTAATFSPRASRSTSTARSPMASVKKGDVVMMAAFAHAGDFAGAAAIRWGGRP